MLNEGKKSAKN
jgi:hypothetical protein